MKHAKPITAQTEVTPEYLFTLFMLALAGLDAKKGAANGENPS